MKDRSFVYKNKTIEFKISDDNKPIIVRNGVEKMSRFITFYYCSKNLGTFAIYGEVEELTNISSKYAEREFEELVIEGALDTNDID